jgi:putative tryptophan/tyrosine transport system substrate-binding protein
MAIHIGRRQFIVTLGGAAATWPLAARAQQPGKVYRIGMLEGLSATLNVANINALREGLRQRGYAEGQNLVIEYRSADGRDDRFPGLARELLALKVDVIITRGTPAAEAAKNATSTVPVVMAASGDPVGVGLVTSLHHPGGNITGLSAIVAELEPKRLELIREIVPALGRIAVLTNMSNDAMRRGWGEIETAARSLGVQSQLLDLRKSDALGPMFDDATARRVDALVVVIDAITLANQQRIVDLAMKHRLPAIYSSREFVDAGGLTSYGVSYPDLYRRAATYVDKILKGNKPDDLPVEQPTKLELVINLKTAKSLGLDVPPTLLARADEVIE